MPEQKASWTKTKTLGRWASFSLLLLGLFLAFSGFLVFADSVREGALPSSPGLGRDSTGALPLAEPTPYFYLDPTILELAADGLGNMAIRTSNVPDLAGIQFSLVWDPALVEVVDADGGKPGTQITPGDLFVGYNTFAPAAGNVVHDAEGRLDYALAIVGDDISVSGAFTVGTIQFHAIGSGSCNVVFTGTVLMAARGGVDVPSGAENGEIRVVAETSTPTATFTQTPIPTIPVPTETLTPTLTATPSNTPTPTATPTISCWEILEDGSFDDPNSDAWILLDQALVSPDQPRTGEKSAWLAGFNNAADGIYQRIEIPSGVTSASFSYWLYVRTQETTHPHDYLHVEVLDGSGTFLRRLETHTDTEAAAHAWQQSTFDLTSYAGQTIRLSFRSQTNASNYTDFFIDDVSLQICAHGYIPPVPAAIIRMPLIFKNYAAD